ACWRRCDRDSATEASRPALLLHPAAVLQQEPGAGRGFLVELGGVDLADHLDRLVRFLRSLLVDLAPLGVDAVDVAAGRAVAGAQEAVEALADRAGGEHVAQALRQRGRREQQQAAAGEAAEQAAPADAVIA